MLSYQGKWFHLCCCVGWIQGQTYLISFFLVMTSVPPLSWHTCISWRKIQVCTGLRMFVLTWHKGRCPVRFPASPSCVAFGGRVIWHLSDYLSFCNNTLPLLCRMRFTHMASAAGELNFKNCIPCSKQRETDTSRRWFNPSHLDIYFRVQWIASGDTRFTL